MRLDNGIARILCCAMLLCSIPAQAHYLWLQPGEVDARLYYGEAEAGLKEKSPGKLDNIRSPKALVHARGVGAPVAANAARASDHFLIAKAGRMPVVLVSEESLEVRDRTKNGLGLVKSNYYARLGQPANPADANVGMLALDIVEHGDNALTVMYRGQPLKHAKLHVIAPNTWVQEHMSNEHGRVQINTPWRGQYVVHVLHVDPSPGEFAGKRYDSLRNHFTYTLIKSSGADAGPPIPPHHSED